MKKTLDFIMDGAAVSRYHTVDLLKSETVGHHSHGVAMLCFLIDPSAGKELLVAALLHDLPEQKVGDIPSPVKRQLKVKQEIDKLENDALVDAGLQFPALHPREKVILKLADIFHGALKCAREINMGNASLRVVFDRYVEYAEELEFPNGNAQDIFEAIKEMVK